MRPGDTVDGRFEIEHEVGSGGMGTVYQARDLLEGKPVAVKTLRDAYRFASEAALLSSLAHPGIVRYLAHGVTTQGERYLVMEWLEGETLEQRLTRRPLSIASSVALALRTCEALSIAHERGIVHRDLKPSNLFLEQSAPVRVKILDFGLARRLSDERLTGSGVIVGTLGYMAPEQARGSNQLDARADVFSLGCVLYECLTGQPAFWGENDMAVLAKILLSEPPSPRDLGVNVPVELQALVAHMLDKDPASRPAHAMALLGPLRAISHQLGPPGPDSDRVPVTPPSRFDSQARTAPMPIASLSQHEQRVVCLIFVGRQAARAGQLQALARAAESYGAQLEHLRDGSTLAWLGGSGLPTDQALQAARCALAMRALVPDAPIALATGRAVVAGRLPIGEGIDRGAGALRIAGPGMIRLDEVTAGLLDPRFDLGGDGQGLFLRGERGLMEAPRTVCGRTTTCVGRDRELALLEGFFLECVSEPVARVVLVTGPAGAGKSRVRHELLERLVARGERFQALLGWGDSLRAGSPFGMIAPALRRAAAILEGEPVEVGRRKLLARLSRHFWGQQRERAWEFLCELAGLRLSVEHDGEALHAARRDARWMGDAMRAAWQDFLEAECADQPVLLVLEDLHWGDLPSVQFVDAALRTLREHRLLVLALARPEVHERFPRLWAEREPHEIRLGALTHKASARLARQVMGPDASAASIAALCARADGNAFYLEELLRAAAAERREKILPDTVVGMVQARLDGLGTEAKRVLRAASVFGQTFWYGGVRALLGEGLQVGVNARSVSVTQWLDQLIEREIIVPVGSAASPAEREYGFQHDLVREAAYAMLTEADRVLGHQLAAEWLLQAGARDPIVLAEHFARGGQLAQAAVWFERAATQALDGNDLDGAIERAERALVCGARDEAQSALRLVQAKAHFWQGAYVEAALRAVDAAQAAQPGSALWYLAAAEMMAALGQQGQYDRVEELLRQTTQAPVDPGASSSMLECLSRAVGYLVHGGRYRQADELLALLEERAGDLESADAVVAARVHAARGRRAIHDGDPATMLAGFTSALALFERIGDLRSACEYRFNLGCAYLDLGRFEQAVTAFRASRTEAERIGLQYLVPAVLANLGLALACLGQLEEARTLLKQAVDVFHRQGDVRFEGGSRMYLSTVAFLSGDFDQSEQEARAAISILTAVAPLRASALAALARALLNQGRTEEALAAAREAMDLLASLGGIEEYEALARLVYVEALEAAGQSEQARVALAEAAQRLNERASRIKDSALRDSFLTRIPEHAHTLLLARTWLGARPSHL